MNTLLLDVSTWDLVLDANANIAVASVPYALAQDVASSLRTFLGEVWYNDTLGIPYLSQILGETPPLSVFQEYMVQAALNTVPTTSDVYVVRAVCNITSFSAATRTVEGQVLFVDSQGNKGSVNLSDL